MPRPRRPLGFTLIEVLIVVVILAVLAATVIPQFSSSAEDAKDSTLRFNQIELYKLHHDGAVPAVANDADGVATLPALYSRTDASGAIGTDPATYPFGPYVLNALPRNPLNGNKYVIVTPGTWPPTAATSAGGWFYNTTTGEIIPNADGHLND
jgi:prepilin-type N-terminal cleavage/methylation domain-containing protein